VSTRHKQKLLIISRDTILELLPGPSSERVFRLLAGFTRKGVHILLSAPEPERWVPTRGNVDSALNNQKILMERARSVGGELEGVYYVPRSLLTQDRNRKGALRDILKRYSVQSSDAALISSSSPFIKAADLLGLVTFKISLPDKQGQSFLDALNDLN